MKVSIESLDRIGMKRSETASQCRRSILLQQGRIDLPVVGTFRQGLVNSIDHLNAVFQKSCRRHRSLKVLHPLESFHSSKCHHSPWLAPGQHTLNMRSHPKRIVHGSNAKPQQDVAPCAARGIPIRQRSPKTQLSEIIKIF